MSEPDHDYPDCACLAVRRLSRRLTQAFDARLAPAGLKVTQFSILAALSMAKPEGARLCPLAESLDMDASTLSRNLRPLVREGLVQLAPGDDARQRHARLTRSGRARLRKATPLWEAAQRDALDALGRDTARTLTRRLPRVRQLVTG